jgi:enoyl-CoA hydratase/carnithine racemase
MGEDRCEIEVKGALVIARIDNQKKRNALGGGVLQDLAKAIETVERDRKLKFLILTSIGDNFSSGMDISGTDPDAMQDRLNLFGSVLTRLEALPVPVLAAVRGMAFGGGFELAMACDMIMASETAMFSLPEPALGACPPFGALRLGNLVGRPRAKEILMTCRRVPAVEAERFGLVVRVVPDKELDSHAMKLAEDIMKKGPIAVQLIKTAVNIDLGGYDLAYKKACELSARVAADFDEGVKAFFEKREPKFKGR